MEYKLEPAFSQASSSRCPVVTFHIVLSYMNTIIVLLRNKISIISSYQQGAGTNDADLPKASRDLPACSCRDNSSTITPSDTSLNDGPMTAHHRTAASLASLMHPSCAFVDKCILVLLKLNTLFLTPWIFIRTWPKFC